MQTERALRHRAPTGGPIVTGSERYRRAIKGRIGPARLEAALAELPGEAMPTEVSSASEVKAPPARLYECPLGRECLSLADVLHWEQMSCALCPLYQHLPDFNTRWLRSQLIASALSKKEK
jgi:hypothetical protein